MRYEWTNAAMWPNRRKSSKARDILRSKLNPSQFWIWDGHEWVNFTIRSTDLTEPEFVPAPLTPKGYMPNPFRVSARTEG